MRLNNLLNFTSGTINIILYENNIIVYRGDVNTYYHNSVASKFEDKEIHHISLNDNILEIKIRKIIPNEIIEFIDDFKDQLETLNDYLETFVEKYN